MKNKQILSALILLATLLFGLTPALAQGRATVTGRVQDEAGARVAAATVALVDASGAELQQTTDTEGRFTFRNVAPGSYTLRVTAEGFAEFAKEAVSVAAGPPKPMDITLSVAGVTENVTVTADTGIGAEPDRNNDALVLKEKDIATLPDDPDELAQALQDLAGPGAGPGGGQFYIDGFTGGRLPPKDSIREIRINSNPFSAEYERIGFGRIEILTKPGSDKFRGSLFGSFNDESLNARNFFAPDRAPEQDRRYGGNVSGPITKKSSFFLDFERREIDESNTVNATILDQALNPVPFATTVPQNQRRTTFAPRFDIQASDKHTLVFRYDFTNDDVTGQGVGGFSLPSRAVESNYREQVFNATDTWVVNPKLISETRLQLSHRTSTNAALDQNAGPAIVVSDAFSDVSPAGITTRRENRLEFQQNFSFASGNHTVRAGVRVRGVGLGSSSTSNYVGTFTFAGDVERDPTTGLPIEGGGTISSIEQYRRVLLGLPGYRPSQFSVIAGEPFASTNQFDLGVFAQDDWRIRPNFTLSLGMRYENQTNAGNGLNFAPRVGFAYSINGADGRPVTVIRGGAGVFFDRIGEDLTLDTVRYDGLHQEQFIVPRPGFFPVVPTTAELDQFALLSTVRRLAADSTPYQIQSSLSVERQLPWQLTGSLTWVWSRGVHQLRTRNINAPLPGSLLRPYGAEAGNILEYEPTGFSRRQQLRFSLNRRGPGPLTLFANYVLGWARSDTDGSGSQPSDPYFLAQDYGRASDDSRHFFVAGTNVDMPWGLKLNTFLMARSGRPYNITSGGDLNGDRAFTDRPSFASPDDPGAILTPIGYVSAIPIPGEPIIPRNAVTGPSMVRVNAGISKTFTFGGKVEGRYDPGSLSRGGGGGGGGPRGGGGGGPRGGGFGGDGGGDQRYGLTFSIRASNLLNHPVFNQPSGVITSPYFGIPNTAQQGRRIETQVRFTF